MNKIEIEKLNEVQIEELISSTIKLSENEIISFYHFILDECYDFDDDISINQIKNKNVFIILKDDRMSPYKNKTMSKLLNKNDILKSTDELSVEIINLKNEIYEIKYLEKEHKRLGYEIRILNKNIKNIKNKKDLESLKKRLSRFEKDQKIYILSNEKYEKR